MRILNALICTLLYLNTSFILASAPNQVESKRDNEQVEMLQLNSQLLNHFDLLLKGMQDLAQKAHAHAEKMFSDNCEDYNDWNSIILQFCGMGIRYHKFKLRISLDEKLFEQGVKLFSNPILELNKKTHGVITNFFVHLYNHLMSNNCAAKEYEFFDKSTREYERMLGMLTRAKLIAQDRKTDWISERLALDDKRTKINAGGKVYRSSIVSPPHEITVDRNSDDKSVDEKKNSSFISIVRALENTANTKLSSPVETQNEALLSTPASSPTSQLTDASKENRAEANSQPNAGHVNQQNTMQLGLQVDNHADKADSKAKQEIIINYEASVNLANYKNQIQKALSKLKKSIDFKTDIKNLDDAFNILEVFDEDFNRYFSKLDNLRKQLNVKNDIIVDLYNIWVDRKDDKQLFYEIWDKLIEFANFTLVELQALLSRYKVTKTTR